MTIEAIDSKRLMLRPYYAGMVSDQHMRWLNDPEVVRYSEQRHKTHTLESIHSYVNDIACTQGSYLWGIFVRMIPPHGSPMIGTISAHIDLPNGVANLGIMIGEKSERGKGYGSEAWNAVCNWLFTERDVRKIEMGCHYENKAMRELALTCGMHMEGVRHDHFVVDGKPQHLLLYAKMKPTLARVTVDESVASESLRERNR